MCIDRALCILSMTATEIREGESKCICTGQATYPSNSVQVLAATSQQARSGRRRYHAAHFPRYLNPRLGEKMKIHASIIIAALLFSSMADASEKEYKIIGESIECFKNSNTPMITKGNIKDDIDKLKFTC